jgi:hypothetical protein
MKDFTILKDNIESKRDLEAKKRVENSIRNSLLKIELI